MGLLPEMALVTLISVYDAYLGRLVRGLLTAKPEVLNASKRQLTYAQLTEFDSLEAAREYLIETEIESLLRENHASHFDWLEARLGIPLRRDLPSWPCFIEITERRNLFVHANGVVGAQYLSVCRKHGADPGPETAVGQRLRVPPNYFKTACDCITEIGVKLGQVVWRKILPGELEAADQALIGTTYELLTLREYRLAETLLEFATGLPRHSSAECLLIYKVNLAIAYSWQKREKECSDLLDGVDWTALADKFQLAEAVLRRDNKRAALIMRRIGKSSEPSKADYRDWPLFRGFRKTEEFREAFQVIFGEPFRLVHPSAAGRSGDSTVVPFERGDEAERPGAAQREDAAHEGADT
jgi:hypothetical protein